jgi:hypothetical protein
MACRHTPPILESAEHDLDAVAPFVSAPVVSDRGIPLLSARDAGAYPLVFQRISEPVGVISTIPEQPIDLWQAAEPRPRADVVADRTCRDEQVERPSFAVADGVQFGIHAAFGATDQAATRNPFFAAMLVAVRCVFR